LEGERVEDIISKLSDAEKALFEELVTKIRGGELGDIPEMQELWRVDYVRQPPTIQEFIDDEYWLGATLHPSDVNPGIFPEWREILTRDFDLDSRVHNVVLTGSLGIGKTYISGTIFLYRLALARLLRTPQHFFGLSRGSAVVYAVLSISRAVVRQTSFLDIVNFMSHSPFFLEECNFNPDMKYSDNRISMGNDIWLIAGSKGWHVIGQNVMGVSLDEGNWRLESNPDEKAYELYDEVRTRIANRFQKIAGYLPAISILASSARDETSFTEKIIGEIAETDDPTTQAVYRYAVYKIRRHLLKLKDRWFKVAHGLKNMEPYILRGWYREDGTPILEEGKPPPEVPPAGAEVELVPEDYREAFTRNCRTALQNFSGISTGGAHRLFASLINVERAIELGERDGLKNPSDVGLVTISMEDDLNVWDYLEHPRFLTRRQSRVVPTRHPEALRFGHLDLATATQAGLGIAHLVGQQLITDWRDGEPFQEYRLVVEYDFILGIIAGQTRPISLEKIQRFFFWLRDYCGYRFGLITADSYASEMPLQMMESRGFKVKILSLDKTKAPYYSWRQGFEESRIRIYRHAQMLREAEKLLDLPKMIEHPKNGSKDVCDAAAGSYFNAITSVADATAAVVHPESPMLYREADIRATDEAPPISIPIRQEPPKEGLIFDA
jgi:hypothetical protein